MQPERSPQDPLSPYLNDPHNLRDPLQQAEDDAEADRIALDPTAGLVYYDPASIANHKCTYCNGKGTVRFVDPEHPMQTLLCRCVMGSSSGYRRTVRKDIERAPCPICQTEGNYCIHRPEKFEVYLALIEYHLEVGELRTSKLPADQMGVKLRKSDLYKTLRRLGAKFIERYQNG